MTAVVVTLAAASAVGGALAGTHPTGTPGVDVAYGAALAALLTLAGAWASRWALLVAAAAAFGMSRTWLYLPAGAALGGAFGSTFQRRSHRRVGALIGALVAQTMLRWPPASFHGFPTLIAAAVAILLCISAWRKSSRVTRHRTAIAAGVVLGLAVLFSIPVLVSALLARGPAERGVSLARSSLDEVESGQSPTARHDLQQAASNLRSARGKEGGWWNLGGYLVPGVAEQQRALAQATRAGDELASSAARVSGSLDFSSLRYQGGRIDLAALEAMRTPVAVLNTEVAKASAELAEARSPWLVAPLDHRVASLGSELATVSKTTRTAKLAVEDGPALLGADGPRTYLVAFMTPAENRGLGGLFGAYGVLSVDQGRIQLTSSGETSALSQIAGQTHITGLAQYLARYQRFDPQDHFQDVGYSPDLPTVEALMAQAFPQVGGVPIDGVLILDPYTLASLLRFTGPISVPGFPESLTSATAAQVLLQTQYLTAVSSNRKDLLQEALSVGFQKLSSGSLPSPKVLADVLDPDVRQGRLLFWSSHPGDDSLIDRLGLSGAFPQPSNGGDLLAVTDANAANNKIDAYLHQQIDDFVTYSPATGRVSETVTIRLTNAAPASDMPPYVIGSYAGSGLPPGTNYTWLSLYSPLQLEGAQLDGKVTALSPSEHELGVNAYSGYVDIPAGTTSVLAVTLTGQLKPGSTYRLTTRLQPLANAQSETVTVRATGGWTATARTQASWSAGSDEIQAHDWSFGH